MSRSHSPLLLLLPLLSSLLVGCASYQVRTPSSDPDGRGYREATLHGFGWKAIPVPATNCLHGFDNLYIEDNLAYDLAGVITLGLWKPIGVRYECRAPAELIDGPIVPSAWTNRTANAFVWGIWKSPLVIAENKAIDGFHDLAVADHFGYDLASVVTLGLWKPMAVRYRLRPDPLR